MIGLLWLIPAIPFASALVLLLFGASLSRRAATAMGVGSIGLSALTAILVAVSFAGTPPAGNAYTQVLWTWIDVAGFRPQIAFYLDALISGDDPGGHLRGLPDSHLRRRVHVAKTRGSGRYFGYMNLFVASMITLLSG